MAERSYSSRLWSEIVRRVMRRRSLFELVQASPPEMVMEIVEKLDGTLLSRLSRYHLHLSNSFIREYTFYPSLHLDTQTIILRLRRLLTRFGSLNEITFDNCSTVDDNVMAVFLQNLNGLGSRIDFGFGSIHMVEMAGFRIRKVHLFQCVGVSPLGFRSVALGCRYLTFLDVSGTLVDDNSLQEFANMSTPLVDVKLATCGLITDVGLYSLIVGCPTIRNISVSGSSGIRGYGFRHGVALEEISVDSCNIDVFDGISAIFASPALVSVSMISVVPERRPIVLDGIIIPREGYAIIRSRSLVYLDMSDCQNMLDNASIIHITEGCPRLEVLRIGRCLSRLDGCWPYLAACHALRILDISGVLITDEGLNLLRLQCPSLTQLVYTGTAVSAAAHRMFLDDRENVDVVDEYDELQFDMD